MLQPVSTAFLLGGCSPCVGRYSGGGGGGVASRAVLSQDLLFANVCTCSDVCGFWVAQSV
jgi:hypothetical protein